MDQGRGQMYDVTVVLGDLVLFETRGETCISKIVGISVQMDGCSYCSVSEWYEGGNQSDEMNSISSVKYIIKNAVVDIAQERAYEMHQTMIFIPKSCNIDYTCCLSI